MPTPFEENPYQSPRTRSESVIPVVGTGGSRGFPVRVFPLWLSTTPIFPIGILIGLTLLFLLERSTPGTRDPNAYFIMTGLLMAGMVGHGVAMFLLVPLSPILLSDVGIRCGNSWGRREFLAWDDITSVETVNFLWLRYFRISGNGIRWPLWLPQFMAKPKLFWPYLLSLLEPASPLAQAIRKAGLAE